MRDDKTHMLYLSTTRGRWALDTPSGPDLTSGQPVQILLGGTAIQGRIEHSSEGYYFLADDNSVCGLCIGMRVRVL